MSRAFFYDKQLAYTPGAGQFCSSGSRLPARQPSLKLECIDERAVAIRPTAPPPSLSCGGLPIASGPMSLARDHYTAELQTARSGFTAPTEALCCRQIGLVSGSLREGDTLVGARAKKTATHPHFGC